MSVTAEAPEAVQGEPQRMAAEERKRINLDLFGDEEDTGEDEDRDMHDSDVEAAKPPRRQKSKNVLGKKEVTLSQCPLLESFNGKVPVGGSAPSHLSRHTC